MKKFYYNEFIEYSNDFSKECNDFYGQFSPLSKEQTKLFLQRYFDFYKKTFYENIGFVKAVNKKEISKTDRTLHLNKKSSIKFTAFKRKQLNYYQNWNFYTDRVSIDGNIINFYDNFSFPVPCAKYDFNFKEISEFKFKVKIGKNYTYQIEGEILPTTMGRTIELRKDCKEIVKLQFLSDGNIICRDVYSDIYRPKPVVLGKFTTNKWTEITIKFFKNKIEFFYNNDSVELEYGNIVPNNIFLSSGMQPVDQWSFQPVHFLYHNECFTDFFLKKDVFEEASQEVKIGRVKLPFCIGTKNDKDNLLILKGSFSSKKNYSHFIKVDSLDPGGEIRINGKTVIRKDDFNPFSLNIDKFIKKGKNNIEVIVFPRAPEVLYPWHKHQDLYNGWFSANIELITEKCSIEKPIIKTIKTGMNTRFTVNFCAKNIIDQSYYTISLQKVYPKTKKGFVLIKSDLNKGNNFNEFSLPIDLWDTNNPNLYKVKIDIYNKNSDLISTNEEITGFRTIEQKEGNIYLNDKRIILKGALNMQFLPPYDSIPISHLCPTTKQIIEQVLSVKNMNGNCLRMHQLGYGSSDKRIAEVCDRLGVLLIWTTRLIDAIENVVYTDEWKQSKDFKKQVFHIINSPSIIMYEGLNEFHASLNDIDKIYDSYVDTVLEVDDSRLICPVSHLYYGGGIYDIGCKYYNDSGTLDESCNSVNSSYGWTHCNVVRSAHTYSLLLGYGCSWRDMVTQNWKWQNELFKNKQKAYLISEFAIIGRQNPETIEAKKFINQNSYELDDEKNALGFTFESSEWHLSQAFQALCASVGIKQLKTNNADGMLWCCLSGGANDASYLKPIIDFYGYKKLAYYVIKDSFSDTTAFNLKTDVLFYNNYAIEPIAVGLNIGNKYSLCIEIIDEMDNIVDSYRYNDFIASHYQQKFDSWKPKLSTGFYSIKYVLTEY